MNGNSFTGAIPASIGDLAAVTYMLLEENCLGAAPAPVVALCARAGVSCELVPQGGAGCGM